MKKIVIISLLLTLITFGFVTINGFNQPINQNVTQIAEIEKAQRRGCCSHHGGVCGCDRLTGRVICCDGTLSPTCT